MNGEVNGTMEESIETFLPNTLDSAPDSKKVSSKDAELEIKHCEKSCTIDNASNQAPTSNTNVEYSGDDNDSGDSKQNQKIEESHSKAPEQENINNGSVENHNSNSNESYSESISSSKTKSETREHERMCNMDEKSKEGESERDNTKKLNTIENSDDEVDSEEDSSDDEGSEVEPRAEDTVSIHSDSDPEIGDETSQESHIKIKSTDVILLETDRPDSQNVNSHDSHSPEIHEIESDNDDCIMADTEEKTSSNISEKKVQLRRSSRAIKRKRYNDDLENGGESDVEEVILEDPLNRKTRPIVINDTKTLVEMAAKHVKANPSNNQKKEPTVVIIDTNSTFSEKGMAIQFTKNSGSSSNTNTQNLYQSIVARGTTVTPVSSKTGLTIQSSSQPSQTTQASILPSLTDDMFVVEAPSFIVPYVYEKPSMKPFREFVDILGKELDEQKAKEEKEISEKQKEDKEKRDKDRQEKKDRGEEVEESDDEKKGPSNSESDEKKKKKAEKKERRRRRNDDDDDVSWDGSLSTDSEDEIMTDEEDKTIVLKDKADSIEEIKDVSDLISEKMCSSKSDNYFDCSLGKFFVNIGLNLVQEFVQTDLLKQQNRKLYREKKTGHSTKSRELSIALLMKNLELSKENNAPYSLPQKKCEFCSFKSESALVITHHLETPHMKNNVYKCNFCEFEIRSPHDILYHMEAEHNTRGKLERAPAYHQCANCPFEDNGKGKLARHLIACAKKFKPEMNLAPPIEWEPPAKIPKIAKSRNNMMGSYQNPFNRSQTGNNLGRPGIHVSNMLPGVSSGYRPRGRSPMSVPTRAAPVHGAPIIRGGVMVRHNSPVLVSSNYPIANNTKQKSVHQPSISITPLPRQPQPVQHQLSKNTFVICEICDGYIKDLEQLRNHMQWIHKVKIHPKMIYNRPPLNCQKCQFRFFTDQGLERHLLGTHGLVTSSMQEAANKGKDAGRCPVCGRVYQWKLLNHVARDHNLTLKPAHLSYKCTVCTATFGMYKQFENHVYSAHSVVAKRVIDKSKTSTQSTKANNDSLLKPLKINDEITIIPQPVKVAASATAKDK